MADLEDKRYYCEKCNKTMKAEKFYTSNNLEKYTNDGKLNQCKECMTMHVDNFNPDTFLWILQEIDVPYIPDVWNKIIIFPAIIPILFNFHSREITPHNSHSAKLASIFTIF